MMADFLIVPAFRVLGIQVAPWLKAWTASVPKRLPIRRESLKWTLPRLVWRQKTRGNQAFWVWLPLPYAGNMQGVKLGKVRARECWDHCQPRQRKSVSHPSRSPPPPPHHHHHHQQHHHCHYLSTIITMS